MKILDRYAEYAIIGGLFWIGMFIFATIVQSSGRDIVGLWTSWINILASLPKFDNGALSSVITSLLSALGVIAVFCTGMLIDIISPMFFAHLEIYYFKRNFLNKNCAQIEKILKGDKTSSMYTDYVQLGTTPVLKNFIQWQSHRHRYSRLLTLLTSYCLKNSGSGMLEDLKDRLVLWKTGRALGGSIFLLALIINALLIIPELQREKIMIGGILILLWILAFFLAMGQYIRMCNTIESIMYLIDNKDSSIK